MERSNNVTASCYCNSFFHKDYLCCTSKFSKTLGYQPNKCHFSKLLLPGARFNLHRQLFSFLKLYCKFYIHKPYSLLALLLALLTFPLLLVTQESRIVCTNTRELHPVMSKSHIQIFLRDRTKCKGPLNTFLLCENCCLHLCTTVVGILFQGDVFKSI